MDAAPPPADQAAIEHVATDEDRLRESLVAYVQARCTPERVEVTHLGTSFRPKPSEELSWSGDPCRPQPSLRVHMASGWRSVHPVLELWVQGPTAPRDLKPGEVFHVERGAVPWRAAQSNPLDGRVRTRVALSKGDPVTPRVARRVPDAERGHHVAIVIRTGSVAIRAPGVTLGPAFVGERIAVRNEATRVVQHGVLIDPNTVSLSP